MWTLWEQYEERQQKVYSGLIAIAVLIVAFRKQGARNGDITCLTLPLTFLHVSLSDITCLQSANHPWRRVTGMTERSDLAWQRQSIGTGSLKRGSQLEKRFEAASELGRFECHS